MARVLSGAEQRQIRARAQIEAQKAKEEAPREFSRDTMIYKEGAEVLQYRRRTGELKNVVHWGQRKLALETIQFFTLYWNQQEIPHPKCLYIGAAPGCSINIMSVLFPDLEWHLYDSAPFNTKIPKKNVTFYNKYFKDEDIEKWRNEKDVFLISDIRDSTYKQCFEEKETISLRSGQYKLNKYDCEKLVLADMLLQERWVYEINPTAASLKFRPPWSGGLYEEPVANFPYLQGHAYYQPWVGPTSTETRLVPVKNEKGNYYSVNWDARKYEDALFYHNVVERDTFRYQNPFSDDVHIDDMELTNDWDSLCETQILRDYLAKVGHADTQENVQKLSRFITNTLIGSGYGCGDQTLKDIRLSFTKTANVVEVEPGTYEIPMS